MSLVLAVIFIIIALRQGINDNTTHESSDVVDDFALMDDMEGR